MDDSFGRKSPIFLRFLRTYFPFQLLPVSGTELWVRALAETMFLQVGFLNILVFLFKSLTKANEEENNRKLNAISNAKRTMFDFIRVSDNSGKEARASHL